LLEKTNKKKEIDSNTQSLFKTDVTS